MKNPKPKKKFFLPGDAKDKEIEGLVDLLIAEGEAQAKDKVPKRVNPPPGKKKQKRVKANATRVKNKHP